MRAEEGKWESHENRRIKADLQEQVYQNHLLAFSCDYIYPRI